MDVWRPGDLLGSGGFLEAGEPREAPERKQVGVKLGNLNFYGNFRPALKKYTEKIP